MSVVCVHCVCITAMATSLFPGSHAVMGAQGRFVHAFVCMHVFVPNQYVLPGGSSF